MSEVRDVKDLDETVCRRCSESACLRTTRREFMIAGGASALSVGALGFVRQVWGAEEPKSLLTPTSTPIKKCLI